MAEGGRQPWTIDGVLPTFLSASTISVGNAMLSLAGFVVLYSTLAVVELFLMIRTVRQGPDGAEAARAVAPASSRVGDCNVRVPRSCGRAGVQAALRRVNAAVVGVLLAALFSTMWLGSVVAPADFAQVIGNFLLLASWRVPPWLVVLLRRWCGVGIGSRRCAGLIDLVTDGRLSRWPIAADVADPMLQFLVDCRRFCR